MAKRKSVLPKTDEDGFRAALMAKPNDVTTHLAYADWLDEHDRPLEAAEQRELGGLSEVYFKLRRKSDGLFSEAASAGRRYYLHDFRWSKKGKLWRTLNSLRAHLTGVGGRQNYGNNTPWTDLEVVAIEVRVSELGALPISFRAEGSRRRLGRLVIGVDTASAE